jgi:hypothetical protein
MLDVLLSPTFIRFMTWCIGREIILDEIVDEKE